ncbi:hypothetical protein ACRAWF_15525, partial [Streptomyces sp. L7]
GFKVNMLRSASGRAYLAYCPPEERATVLRRLRDRGGPGEQLAEDPNAIRQLVETTRHRGVRQPLLRFRGRLRAQQGRRRRRARVDRHPDPARGPRAGHR